MTADLRELRRSPWHDFVGRFDAAEVTGDRGVRLREVPYGAMAGVRTEPGGHGYQRIGSVLGLELPRACGDTTSSPANGEVRHTALWLGPDEWLLVSTDDTVVTTLTEAFGSDPVPVVDLSANRCIVELSGPSARRVLEKGCPVDLHPSAFRAGQAISTHLGPVPLILWQTGESTYRLLPRISYASYLARWLLDAVAEFAGPEVA
ncbi:MAG TPA: sarcosine oxidase subunit gamma family protein [Propionibacteriaceae bacterium]